MTRSFILTTWFIIINSVNFHSATYKIKTVKVLFLSQKLCEEYNDPEHKNLKKI